MPGTLVSLLGESPPVTSSFIKSFQTGLFNKVIIIANENAKIIAGARLIKAALSFEKSEYAVEISHVPVTDVLNEEQNFVFMKHLSSVIMQEKNQDRDVFLNITGGRVAMSVSSQIIGGLLRVQGTFVVTTPYDKASKEKMDTLRDLISSFSELSDAEAKNRYDERWCDLHDLMFPDTGQQIIRIPTIPHSPKDLYVLLNQLRGIAQHTMRLTDNDRGKLIAEGYVDSATNDISDFGIKFLDAFSEYPK